MPQFFGFVDPVAGPVVQRLLNGMLAGMLLTTLVWGLLRLLKQANATTRYWVWGASLLAVAALPLLMAGSAWHKGQGRGGSGSNSHPSPALPVAAQIENGVVPRLGPPEPPRTNRSAKWGRTDDGQLNSSQEFKAGEVLHIPAATPGVDQTPDFQRTKEQPSLLACWAKPLQLAQGRWVSIGTLLWGLFSLVMMSRLVWSCRHMHRLKTSCVPLAGRFQDRLNRWRVQCATNRPVRLCQSADVAMPLTVGLAHPIILLPEKLAESLNESELDQIGLHEIAHLRRWDDWTNLVQRLLEALLFFHPAVLWIGRQLNLDREVACDDWVVLATGQSRPYAACLTKLAELTIRVQRPVPAPGAILFRKHLIRRIEMLLDKQHNRTVRLSKVGLLLGLGVLIFGLIELAQFFPLVAISKADNTQLAPRVQLASVVATGEQNPAPTSKTAKVPLKKDDSSATPQHSSQESSETDLVTIIDENEEGDATEELSRSADELGREIDLLIKNNVNLPEMKKLLEAHKEEIREQAARIAEQAKALAKQQVHIKSEAIEQAMERAQETMAFHLEELPEVNVVHLGTQKHQVSENELLPRLVQIVRTDSSIEVRKEAISAIGRMNSDASLNSLLQLYDGLENKELKMAVISRLLRGKGDNTKVLEKLKQITLTSPDPDLRQAAIRQLFRAHSDAAADTLTALYDSSKDAVSKEAIIRGLGHNGSKKAIDKLMAIATSDGDSQMRVKAVRRLGALSGGEEWGIFPDIGEDIPASSPKVAGPKRTVTPRKSNPAPGPVVLPEATGPPSPSK
jgi:beta-lactamase regulating signal transducer with metallopeptidase domain/HEAT repeat protein